MKKWSVLFVVAALLAPWQAWAANGAACLIDPPTGRTDRNEVVGSCVDVCDYTSINGALTCGPIWMPLQNAASTSFTVMADVSDCPFDTLDIVRTLTSGSPADNWKEVLGTLDDDGTGGTCGGAICVGLHVPYPIAGYIWVTSNGATVGSGTCASFKLRMTQGKQ